MFESHTDIVHKFFSSNTTGDDGERVAHRNVPLPQHGERIESSIEASWIDAAKVCKPTPHKSHCPGSLAMPDLENECWDAAPTLDSPICDWDDSEFLMDQSVAVLQTHATGSACRQGAERIEGLERWLQALSLQRYASKAAQWCTHMGAISVEEIEENWEDLAEALKLKPLERKRLAKQVML